jgi:nanoRNase/pAp phosphatase (c-di-AMP/oligoRNAs hydrolase)
MGLFSYPYGIREWNYASRNIDQLVKDGEAIERKHQKDIAELIKVMAMDEIINGFAVPCVNLPYTMASDACEKLLEMFPSAPFAASWYMRADGHKVFSLRSRPTGVNVAEVAEVYGGGGHANAAGFTL